MSLLFSCIKILLTDFKLYCFCFVSYNVCIFYGLQKILDFQYYISEIGGVVGLGVFDRFLIVSILFHIIFGGFYGLNYFIFCC